MTNNQRKRELATVLLISVSCLALFMSASAQTNRKPHSWWPQKGSVQRDEAASLLIISSPYYTFQHDLKKGGVLTKIQLTNGKVSNLLVTPIETRIRVARKEEAASPPAKRGTGSPDIFSDINDPKPSVTSTESGDSEIVTVACTLLNQKGLSCGVAVKTTYVYRWGYVKIRKEFIAPKSTVRARHLSILSAVFDPSLTDYGHRPAASEEFGSDLHTWQNGQIRQWGKMRPGTHLDLPFQTRFIPRYIVLANPGVEGIEWFPADDLSQWDYQMTGQPGTGYCEIAANMNPLGVAVSIYPYSLSARYELPKGGAIDFRGSYVFDYYLGIPILEGHAWQPWLDKGFIANGGKWVTEEEIKKNAESGLITMRLHNDGDSNRDGLFWRDGSYPPYPPEEMKKMEKVIETCHKYGLKVAPYFSNHELHQSTEEFKKHGEEWGRKPDDQGNLRPNFVYGPLMCLKSGWLDYFKLCVDRVLKNHPFDGAYYDWNLAMYCNNPLHVGKKSNGVSGKKGLAALAESPTGHWDIDEFIEMVEWTRKRVGPDGLVLLHNTLVPMFATENFANFVVGMEFTYGQLSFSVPKPQDLPLEWNFVGARSRAVIGYGTLFRGAPKSLSMDHALTALVTSVAPWPATDEYIDVYRIFKPLGDFEQYKFEDYRTKSVKLDGSDCLTAVYSRPGEAYILLANLDPQPKKVRCQVNPMSLPYPLASISRAEVLTKLGAKSALESARLMAEGATVTVPADDVVMLHIKEDLPQET
jgi:hypothetical protein